MCEGASAPGHACVRGAEDRSWGRASFGASRHTTLFYRSPGRVGATGPLHGLIGRLHTVLPYGDADHHRSASSSHNPGYRVTKPISDTSKGAA